MNNAISSSDALLNYIDALLFNAENEGDGQIENTFNPITSSDCVENTAENIKVDYIQNDFKLLLFYVSGIPLAISYDSLSYILEVDRRNLKYKETKNGIARNIFNFRGQDVQVLESHDIIFPNDHPAHRQNDDIGDSHVLVFNGHKYGLLCNDIGDRINLDRQDIEWREQRVSRPWLAGIVKGNSHALLDDAVIIDMCK
jgi:purine-binding chemotaxis protein CheW